VTIPALTTDQMREVDRIMVDDLGISLIQMMENAGRSLARLTIERFSPASVTVLAGPGGNGGGGLAAARHLANRGIGVTATLVKPVEEMAAVPARQAGILEQMGVVFEKEPQPADLVIDAILGYSLQGDPRGRAADLVRWANGQRQVISLDTPSGLDTTTGRVGDPCVRASATMTLALPKTGLRKAPEVVGDLYLADISVPPSVYEAFGFEVGDLFATGSVVSIS
jgi:NAD(P)H-hydrate epimerase